MDFDTYEQWMAAVDEILDDEVGLCSEDLADQSYRTWYEDGMTPQEAADFVMEEEGL